MKNIGLFFIVLFLVLTGIYFFLNPSKDEFVEGDLYDEILSRGKIKVGINVDSKPFGFYDEHQNIVGYDADLARYIAQYILKNKNGVEFVLVNPSNRLIKASTGEADIVISTVTITRAREEVVDFSIPYDSAGQALLVRANSKISSLGDLAGLNVGVIFGTTAERNVKTLVPTANMRGFRSYKDAYEALKAGQIDAITSDDVILNRFSSYDKSVKLLPRKYSREPYGIAFKKGDSTKKLKENIDNAIRDLQDRNRISKLRKKWGIDF